MKTLSLASIFLFAAACSSSNGGTTSTGTSGPGASSSSSAASTSAGSASGATGTGTATAGATGGTTGGTRGSATGGTSAGTSSGGAPQPFIGSLGIVTIGSTVDTNGDQNPYGLAIAPVTAGSMTQGDLVICNFNDSANVQGNGTTIEVLHPTPGATPTRLVQDTNLKGCAAVAMGPTGDPWATAFVANLAPFYSPGGVLVSTLSTGPWNGPWSETFAPAFGSGAASFVVSDATAGNIVRINLGSSFTFDTLITGFTLNAGAAPGNILGPAGLTYDATKDTLFVVDSNKNRLLAFSGYSGLAAGAITLDSDAGFSGPSAASARVVYSGTPLNAPLSAAELFNGDLIVANTADNVLVEISQSGQLMATQNLDTGAAGALFGLAVSGANADATQIFFNDDNDNTVKQMTNAGMLGSLAVQTIGSTVDPTNGDQNPYGLGIAPVTAGSMTQGDLVICNFNDSANVQGNGTTIEILHPTPGSAPTRLVQDPNLKGCGAVAMGPTGDPWVTGFVANLAPFYSSSGVLVSSLSAGPWDGPWSEAFAPAFGSGAASFVVSNATGGNIVRINLGSSFTFDTLITGFTLNAGAAPGNILGPAGLTYDATTDKLFVVDSNQGRLLSFSGYSTLAANAIVLNGDGSFSGPSATAAHVVFSGDPLNAPLSAAELFNGNLIVANTGDNNLVEISQAGVLVGTQNLDTGDPGALFGLAVSGSTAADTKIYFNDDNANAVQVLTVGP